MFIHNIIHNTFSCWKALYDLKKKIFYNFQETMFANKSLQFDMWDIVSVNMQLLIDEQSKGIITLI